MLAAAEPSLLSELRAATRACHAALDGKLALVDGAVSKDRYEAFLRGSLFALTPLEGALAPWAPAHRSRSSLIRADLEALGAAVPALPLDLGQVRIDRVAQAFGARYVIEGSALGGAVLARSFQQALGLGADCLHYLTLHGDRLGEHWRGFTNELEAWGKSATFEMRSEACDTARAVFDVYEVAFERAGACNRHS